MVDVATTINEHSSTGAVVVVVKLVERLKDVVVDDENDRILQQILQ